MPSRHAPLPQAKVSVLGLLGPGRAAAALVAAHCASRWSCLPLVYGCQYIQDEEDAKRGLYNCECKGRGENLDGDALQRQFIASSTLASVPRPPPRAQGLPPASSC